MVGWRVQSYTAFIFGWFYPRAAWQWDIYVLAGQIPFLLIAKGGDMNQLPFGVALYAVLLVPAALSGVLGAHFPRLFSRPPV
jgi:hypothetical protein